MRSLRFIAQIVSTTELSVHRSYKITGNFVKQGDNIIECGYEKWTIDLQSSIDGKLILFDHYTTGGNVPPGNPLYAIEIDNIK